MEFSAAAYEKRKQADVLAIPYWKTEAGIQLAAPECEAGEEARRAIELQDFKGKEGEVLFLYPAGFKEKRLALLGLGTPKGITIERLRRAYSALVKECLARHAVSVNVVMPRIQEMEASSLVLAVSEGLLLANYLFDQLKSESSKKEDPPELIKKFCLVGAPAASMKIAEKTLAICEAVCFARDLINRNADDVTPQTLAETARGLARDLKKVKATVFDKKRIEKEKMGLLLAVNRASALDPAFIILEYKGDPKSKDHTVIVGKGVTYDTGGLSLKPTASMLDMKCDMSGAATALGVIYAAAKTELKRNVTAVIPSTDNSIGSKSYKLGDVYVAHSGKTVEIDNTDAEGRLILADALSYAVKHLSPTRIVDFATLTGAIVIALGEEATGLMSNHDELAAALAKAGEATYERVWRLPLYEEYKSQLKSDFADLKNTGGREASSITAALFLQEFVGNIPWAHLDIAGTAHLSKPRRYHPKHGTGIGIRLMMEFLAN